MPFSYFTNIIGTIERLPAFCPINLKNEFNTLFIIIHKNFKSKFFSS